MAEGYSQPEEIKTMVGNTEVEIKGTLPLLRSKWKYAGAGSLLWTGYKACLQVDKQAESEAEL